MMFGVVAVVVTAIIGILVLNGLLPQDGGIILLCLWLLFVGSYCVFAYLMRREEAERRSRGIKKAEPQEPVKRHKRFQPDEPLNRRDFASLGGHSETLGFIAEGERRVFASDTVIISNVDSNGIRGELAVYSRGMVSNAKYRVGRLTDEANAYLVRLYKHMLESAFTEVNIEARITEAYQLRIKVPFTIEPEILKLHDIPELTLALSRFRNVREDDLVLIHDGAVKHLQSGKIIGRVDYADTVIGRIVKLSGYNVLVQTVTKEENFA